MRMMHTLSTHTGRGGAGHTAVPRAGKEGGGGGAHRRGGGGSFFLLHLPGGGQYPGCPCLLVGGRGEGGGLHAATRRGPAHLGRGM